MDEEKQASASRGASRTTCSTRNKKVIEVKHKEMFSTFSFVFSLKKNTILKAAPLSLTLAE